MKAIAAAANPRILRAVDHQKFPGDVTAIVWQVNNRPFPVVEIYESGTVVRRVVCLEINPFEVFNQVGNRAQGALV